jgi:hypothetical protein
LAEPIEGKRRLAAIFTADVEGNPIYGADEVATLDATSDLTYLARRERVLRLALGRSTGRLLDRTSGFRVYDLG